MLSVGKPMYRTIDEIYPRKIGITISNLYTIPQFQFPYLCNKENKLYNTSERLQLYKREATLLQALASAASGVNCPDYFHFLTKLFFRTSNEYFPDWSFSNIFPFFSPAYSTPLHFLLMILPCSLTYLADEAGR